MEWLLLFAKQHSHTIILPSQLSRPFHTTALQHSSISPIDSLFSFSVYLPLSSSPSVSADVVGRLVALCVLHDLEDAL